MKSLLKILLSLAIIIKFSVVLAQNGDDDQLLNKQAVQLNKEGKYAEAVEKYMQALKIDSSNVYANYGIAYSLLASGKGNEGIPYLKKVINANTKLTALAYDLLNRQRQLKRLTTALKLIRNTKACITI